MQHTETVDLIQTLRRIEGEAKRAKDSLAVGRSKTGTTALERIRAEASDAVARAEERRAQVPA